MNQKVFSFVCGIVFIFGALVHIARLAQGWDVVVAGMPLPLWASWAAMAVCGVLGFYGLKHGTRP